MTCKTLEIRSCEAGFVFTFDVSGFGFGLMYLPAIVMVGFYFEKRRALATGVAVCGSGIGGFIFPPMSRYLVSEYSWQGATLIIAGICLNGVAIGLLFYPLIPKTIEPEHEGPMQVLLTSQTDDVTNSPNNDLCALSLQNLSNCSAEPPDVVLSSVDNLYLRMRHNKLSSAKNGSHFENSVNNPLNRKDIFYSGSIQNLPLHTAKAPPGVKDMKPEEQEDEEKSGCVSGLKQTMDISLLGDPVFLIYGISCFLCMYGT